MTLRRWCGLAAVLFLVTVGWPVVARAAALPTRIVMAEPVALAAREEQKETVMVLGATLTTADGKPVANQMVEFLMAIDILGQKKASIGSAVSDSGGAARTTFVVTRSGSFEFSARFRGTDAFEASEAPWLKTDLQALAAPSTHQPLRLSLIGRWVPWAGLGLTAMVWLTLIFVVGRVLIHVPRAARRQQ